METYQLNTKEKERDRLPLTCQTGFYCFIKVVLIVKLLLRDLK